MTSEDKFRQLILYQRMYEEAIRMAKVSEARSAELLTKVTELLDGQGRMSSDLSSPVSVSPRRTGS